MNLPIIGQIQHKAFTASGDPGRPTLSWGDPEPVDTYGWWQPSQDEILGPEAGRDASLVRLAVMVPTGTACGHRDQWIVDGATFEQAGGPQDYSHGPFGMDTPLLVYLKEA